MAHQSLRPWIWTAPALYAKLQHDQANAEIHCGRLLILLCAFAMLAVTPTAFMWRVGVVACIVTLALFMRACSDLDARNWFMHRLTLQDCFDDARWSFGGPEDIDTQSSDVEAGL